MEESSPEEPSSLDRDRDETREKHMRAALREAQKAMGDNVGGPFGAVIVREGLIVARGRNRVLASKDPTAHAEIVAIRAAADALGTHDLSGTTLFSSCEPCPMCLAASFWARIDAIWYAGSRHDAAAIGFDDETFYDEFARPPEDRHVPIRQLLGEKGAEILSSWGERSGRTLY